LYCARDAIKMSPAEEPYVKSIIIVTLAAPLMAGCAQLSPHWGAPAQSAAAKDAPPAQTAHAAKTLPSASPPDKIQLRPSDGLEVARLLERDDVTPELGTGDDEFRREQAKALRGDPHAAMRVAGMYAEGSNGVARDERRMVQWLKHASVLDHGGASYQLYLYYLARGLDRDAVRYERRALRQGYTIPARLDNRRG
jgi:TPR repeat protein